MLSVTGWNLTPADRLERAPRAPPQADLKIQWALCNHDPAGGVAWWCTIDTDAVCQSLLSGPRIRARGTDVFIVFPPPSAKLATKFPQEVVNVSAFPQTRVAELALAILLPGCDYTESALGYGLEPSRVLEAEADAVPSALCVDSEQIEVDHAGLVALLSALWSKKTPRKVYMCSGGRTHLTKRGAQNVSLKGFEPKIRPRVINDLASHVCDILTVIW